MGIKKDKPKPKPKVIYPTFTGRARPQIANQMTVLEAARNRMRWIFDEFDGKVSVSCSGGKDSTVILELAAEVARERGEKLKVVFIDQEAEYQGTVDYMRGLQQRDDIDLHWYQVPFKLFNATNHADEWLNVWGPGEDWMRPMEPDSIKDKTWTRKDGTTYDRWMEIVSCVNREMSGAILVGMRAEESPTRRILMVSSPGFKWATWSSGKTSTGFDGEPMVTFNPIWDWSYRDVWKYIETEGHAYNNYYDKQFQMGVPVRNMRVSSFNHAYSARSLLTLQEMEPETWEAATRRLEGLSTYAHLGRGSDLVPGLPYMFQSWMEYAAYLIDNLAEERHRGTFYRMWENLINVIDQSEDWIATHMVNVVIRNDYTGKSNEQILVNNRKGTGRHSAGGITKKDPTVKRTKDDMKNPEEAFQ